MSARQEAQRIKARDDIIDTHPHLVLRTTGCDLHGDCLTCPFPQCRYDPGGQVHSVRSAARATEIQRLRKAGRSVEAIAQGLGVSTRTVHRALRKAAS